LLGAASFVLLLALNAYLQPALGPSNSSEPVRVFYADHISRAHRELIAEFNQLHAGRIEVVPVDLPFEKFSTNERKELLARSLRSKSEKLDVFAVDLIWVSRFARWGEPLDAYFPPSVRAGFMTTALKSCIVGDTLVAMPLYLDVGVLYYRRDLIQRLPDGAAVERRLQSGITWEELESLRKRLGYERRPFFVYPAKAYEGLICCFLEHAMGDDSTYLDQNRLAMTEPAAGRALARLVQFVRKGWTPAAATGFDENQSYRWFLDNDAVFVRGWPNFIENFSGFYPDTSKLRAVARAPLPHSRGGSSRSVFGGWNLMISRASSKKAEAVEFIKFLQSPRSQRLLFELSGYIPVHAEVYRDKSLIAEHPELSLYHALVQRGFHRPMIVDYTRTSDIASHFLHRAIRGDLTVDDALRQADAMIRSNSVLLK
jgi:multiple sugar transport system substrate-binding protein